MDKRVAMVVALLALLTAALGTTASSAASSEFSAKANAICAKAIAQKKAAKYVPPADPRAMALAAANGAKWLAADNAAYKALKLLKAPTDNADDFKVMLAKRQGAISALVKAVKAAKAGSRATFSALYLKSSTLAGGSGLRAWSMELKACENWF
jgi:hypothetical protein